MSEDNTEQPSPEQCRRGRRGTGRQGSASHVQGCRGAVRCANGSCISARTCLVLVATEDAPYGTAVTPFGNVLWIDPFTETTFLDILSEIGIVELLVNEN